MKRFFKILTKTTPCPLRIDVASPSEARPFTLNVEHFSSDLDPQTYTFTREHISIGRATECEVPLCSPLRIVSRKHAQIRQHGGACWLVDLGSKNATWLNGERLEVERPYMLRPGDRFIVGDFQVEFVALAA